VLDVNTGPAAEDAVAAMQWLVAAIREVTDATLAIDTTSAQVMRAGLQAAAPNAMLNSTTGVQEKLDALLPLAAEFKAPVIGLTIDEKGVPRDAMGRNEVALRIVASAMEHGIATDQVYIDPVILPVNVAQSAVREVLNAIRECKLLADPSPKTILGLSNVSQGTACRELINGTMLVMALANGLDAAIMDPFDTAMMDAMIAAELLLDKHIYCDDFLKAYRAGR
jgi:5-methyltetrahydrofolate corrinoid/iron sulfur protein methyltransferase